LKLDSSVTALESSAFVLTRIGLRNLLAEDVRLDMVNRRVLTRRQDVSAYFARYAEIADWRISSCLAEGRPALLVATEATSPASAMLCCWIGKRGASRRFAISGLPLM
jgi:hypothetical protein